MKELFYLIVGNDKYIRNTEESKIKNKFLSPEEVELNYAVYSPDNINAIMDSLGTVGFLSDRRVVLVNSFQNSQDILRDALLNYMENPTTENILIISSDASFKKTKYFKKYSNLCSSIKADEPDAGTIKRWILLYFKKQGIEINPRAVDLILELKGTNSNAVKMEIEKLASFSGGARIEVDHVEELVGRSVSETVFSLVDALNQNNMKWAYRIINDLYDQKKQPFEIIGYLTWYVRIMQTILHLQGKGTGLDGISRGLGYSVGYTKRLQTQSRKYNMKKVNIWLNAMLDADLSIKTGKKRPQLAIDMLLAKLMESKK